VVGADQGLGAGSHQAINSEGPAVGVAQRQVSKQRPQVGLLGQVADEVAGEHHLFHIAIEDVVHRRTHGHHKTDGRQGPGPKIHAEFVSHRCGRAHGTGGRVVVLVRLKRVLLNGDIGDPAGITPTPNHHGRHDQYARGRGGVSKGKGPERDEAGAGKGHGVVDVRGCGDPLPGGRGIRHTIWPRKFKTPGNADPSNALPTPDENQRMPRIYQRDEGTYVVDLLSRNPEDGHFARSLAHPFTVLREHSSLTHYTGDCE